MVVKGRLCDWSMEGCFVGHKSSKENKIELTIFPCMGQSVIFSTNICKLRSAMIYSFAHRDSGTLKALSQTNYGTSTEIDKLDVLLSSKRHHLR
jgi:hypothetical protein